MSIQDVNLPNPIRKIRTELRLTQNDAAVIADVTEQVILKAEQGLYPTLPPSVLFTFSNLSNLSVGIIEAMYEDWINQELLKVKLPVGSLKDAWKSADTFAEWRDAACSINKVHNSINGLAKLLKLNPYVLQKYKDGKLKATPLQLVERISFIEGAF